MMVAHTIKKARGARTLTGKKMELPVKKLLLGMRIDEVANPDAMSNPGSLSWFVEFAKHRELHS
jgi:acetoacetyl-CoA synthetase